jgi:hypothetical protein
MDYLIKLVYSKIGLKDVWLVFELGGNTLQKQLFEVKGCFYKSERIYQINN